MFTNMGQDKIFVIKFKIFYFLTSLLKLCLLDYKKKHDFIRILCKFEILPVVENE
jgi:hypothetical protein